MAQNINPFYSSQSTPNKAKEEKQNVPKDNHATAEGADGPDDEHGERRLRFSRRREPLQVDRHHHRPTRHGLRRIDLQVDPRVSTQLSLQRAHSALRHALLSSQRRSRRQHLSGHTERQVERALRRSHHTSLNTVLARRAEQREPPESPSRGAVERPDEVQEAPRRGISQRVQSQSAGFMMSAPRSSFVSNTATIDTILILRIIKRKERTKRK